MTGKKKGATGGGLVPPRSSQARGPSASSPGLSTLKRDPGLSTLKRDPGLSTLNSSSEIDLNIVLRRAADQRDSLLRMGDELEYISDSEYQELEKVLAKAEASRRPLLDIEDTVCGSHKPAVNTGDASYALVNQVRGRKGILWVTDLCSVEWCGLQNQYQVGEVHARVSNHFFNHELMSMKVDIFPFELTGMAACTDV